MITTGLSEAAAKPITIMSAAAANRPWTCVSAATATPPAASAAGTSRVSPRRGSFRLNAMSSAASSMPAPNADQ